jgi:uncharacterized protein (TIGR00369 family)
VSQEPARPPAVSRDEVNAFFAEAMPFCRELGISCESVGIDEGIARFAYHERWTRPGGFINGGTLMALADVAVYIAVFSAAGITPLALTNELKMNFLRPAIGGDVLARARLRKLGRRVAFADVDVYMEAEPGRLVAHATSSYVMPEE